MSLDMVLDKNNNPAWCGNRAVVVGFLKVRLRDNPSSLEGCTVRTGFPHKFLTVDEYLNSVQSSDDKPCEAD